MSGEEEKIVVESSRTQLLSTVTESLETLLKRISDRSGPEKVRANLDFTDFIASYKTKLHAITTSYAAELRLLEETVSQNKLTNSPGHTVALGQLNEKKAQQKAAYVALQSLRAQKESVKTEANRAYFTDCFERDLLIVLRDSYFCGFKLEDIALGLKRLEDILTQLNAKGDKDAFDYLSIMNPVIDNLSVDAALKEKANPDDLSTYQLLVRLNEKIKTLQSSMNELQAADESENTTVTRLNRELQTCVQRLKDYQNEVKELKQRYDVYRQVLKQREAVLKSLHTLDSIMEAITATYPEYLQDKAEPVITQAQRTDYLNALSHFISQHSRVCDAVTDKDNPSVKTKYLAVKSALEKIRLALWKIKFQQAEDEINALLASYEAIQTNPMRIRLQAAIREFKDRQEVLIVSKPPMDNEWLQLSSKRIQAKLQELNFKEKLLNENEALPEETPEERKTREYQEHAEALRQAYFVGKEAKQGVFSAYLSERAISFWLKDCFRSFAALGLGCLGYKTDAQLRQEFIFNQLKPAFEALVSAQTANKEELFEALHRVLDQGIKDFSPRAKAGTKGYEQSLRCKLESFKSALEVLKPLQSASIESLHNAITNP